MAIAGSKIWNEIPKEIRMAQTLHSFKEHLNKHLCHTAGTVIMTHWFTLLTRVWGPLGELVLSGSGSHQYSGGHCADGVVMGGGGRAGGCWSYFGISIQRLRLVSMGLGGFGVSWGLHHLGGNPIDIDSNKILRYVCFSFSGNCVQS